MATANHIWPEPMGRKARPAVVTRKAEVDGMLARAHIRGTGSTDAAKAVPFAKDMPQISIIPQRSMAIAPFTIGLPEMTQIALPIRIER